MLFIRRLKTSEQLKFMIQVLSCVRWTERLVLAISGMLASRVLTSVKQVPVLLRRNIGVCALALQKATDPIQQLFIDKIREYAKKSSAAGGKLVDPTPEIQKELSAELEKVAKQFGGGEGTDMTQFPSFSFKDPEIDPINQEKS